MKYDARRAEFIFGQPMKACPACGGYKIRHQTPIQIKEPVLVGDSAKQIVGKWARTIRDGCTALEGPVFIMCFDCGHKGPSMDCTGRTAEDVGRDPVVAATVKRLWNEQASA